MNTKDFNSILFSINYNFDNDTEDNAGELYLVNDIILYKGDSFTDTRFVVNY